MAAFIFLKPKYHNYPRIEIKTSSKILIKQLLDILRIRKFNPTLRRTGSKHTFAILLSSHKLLEKWAEEIGFNTAKNLSKY